jgi:cytoskeleton protein RodZ
MIRDIESGNIDFLPHSVYARGFVKSYAKLLGMDMAELEPYFKLFDEQDESGTITIINSTHRGAGREIWTFRLLFLLLLIGAGGYWYYTNYFMRNPMAVFEPKQVSPSPNHQSAGFSEKAEDHAYADMAGVVTSDPYQTEEQSSAFAAQNAGPPPQATIGAPMHMTGTPGMAHLVIITGVAECWVHATVDGGAQTREFSVNNNESFLLNFNRTLTIRLGNAGGVRIRYDGAEFPLGAASGQVKTVNFPPQ